MSLEVKQGQDWLNATYAGRPGYIYVNPTGLPGSATSAALVSAMQIELGMSTVSGVFGDQTSQQCDAHSLIIGDSGNRVKILQYGLYSKGYDPGSATGLMNSKTATAVQEIIADAGITISPEAAIAGMQMKAILGVDEYKLVGDGDTRIRAMQQDLNRRYRNYTGLCACDGHYSRSTNAALIYALQCEEGMSTSTATGEFGPMTRSYCPDLGDGQTQWNLNGAYDNNGIANCITLAQYALYCIGRSPYKSWSGSGSDYDPGTVQGQWNSATIAALKKFQADVGLPVKNWMGLDDWMGLLVSTGNPNRDGAACDCSTQILTRPMAQALVDDQYEIVGRYLTGTVGGGANKQNKNLTRAEITTIFNAGLRLFCIFQDDEDWWQGHNDLSGYFTYSRGYQDAKKATLAARDLGIPSNEYIYFAVDYDFMEGEVWENVVPYFNGINDYMSYTGNPYRIGIYSARNICGIVSSQGLATSSFVSDMSTGYSGNLGFPLPSNWAFDQIKEYTNSAGFAIDKNVASGKYTGFNQIESTPPIYSYTRPEIPIPDINTVLIQNMIPSIRELEDLYHDYCRDIFSGQWPPDVEIAGKQIARGVLNYLRSLAYWNFQWTGTTGVPIDNSFVNKVETQAPSLQSFFQPYIQADSSSRLCVTDSTSGTKGLIDLAHMAATMDTYAGGPGWLIPSFWAGWGGDLASGMADVTERMLDNPAYSGMTAREVADLTIGAEIGPHKSSCNYSDFCSDIDGYMLGTRIESDASTNKYLLSDLLTWYYGGPHANRFDYFASAIDPSVSWNDLPMRIRGRMRSETVAGLPLNIIDLLGESNGRPPTFDVELACCKALTDYIISMI